MGYLIGYERKNREKNAGMRTHAIVCMGSALIMIVSKYSFRDIPDYDASRVAAQIVSGIGFLGAGIIFIRNNAVSGLTTAAGIWATAGVGMAIGAGSCLLGICSGVLIVITQMVLHMTSFLTAEPYRGFLKVTTGDYEQVIEELRQQFRRERIREVNVKITKNKAKEETKVEFDLLFPPQYEKNQLIYELAKDERIHGVSG
ncbi:MAG TPA: MgtC/SapB family protein [Candidatus Enterocloster faecavium]|uniref:MgtC/SapB family protein n=1 Tax=Candidatus Enterocloster faecavium TaxID=2838560 RepID=A0A9D2RLJ9_9FIRM|nr:MgtC/SapB family protein [Candidatus Enterocloster faecavium]